MAGVSINKKREKPKAEVDLTTPYGTQITVSAKRAETLLKRGGIRLGDQKLRKYVPAGENPEVPEETSGAAKPRQGSRVNTGGE